jgi:hypothetical protein
MRQAEIESSYLSAGGTTRTPGLRLGIRVPRRASVKLAAVVQGLVDGVQPTSERDATRAAKLA